MKIYCVIPAYNEAKRLKTVLEEVLPIVSRVVLVDDGSTDDTFELAKSSGATVLRHVINRGQGAALRTGTEYCIRESADIIVHFDADGQFLAADILKAIEPIIHNGMEMVFGSRFLGIDSNMPKLKKFLIMPLARLINRMFLGVKLTDPQSGFRVFSLAAAKKFNWQQNGMAHASEILHAVSKAKLKITEVPITVVYHDFGQRFSGGLRIIKDLLISSLID